MGQCPRCGGGIIGGTRLKNGQCPECDWPAGIRKPDRLTEKDWNGWKRQFREHIRKEQIRQKAVVAVKKAIKTGQLKCPKECQMCGRVLRHRRHRVKPGTRRYPELRKYAYRLEAHHRSYYPEDWLDVIWVCPLCHHRWHRKNPPEYPPPDVIAVDIKEDTPLFKEK